MEARGLKNRYTSGRTPRYDKHRKPSLQDLVAKRGISLQCLESRQLLIDALNAHDRSATRDDAGRDDKHLVEYGRWNVKELRTLVEERGMQLKGLSRKQHYIDALVADDTTKRADEAEQEANETEATTECAMQDDALQERTIQEDTGQTGTLQARHSEPFAGVIVDEAPQPLSSKILLSATGFPACAAPIDDNKESNNSALSLDHSLEQHPHFAALKVEPDIRLRGLNSPRPSHSAQSLPEQYNLDSIHSTRHYNSEDKDQHIPSFSPSFSHTLSPQPQQDFEGIPNNTLSNGPPLCRHTTSIESDASAKQERDNMSRSKRKMSSDSAEAAELSRSHNKRIKMTLDEGICGKKPGEVESSGADQDLSESPMEKKRKLSSEAVDFDISDSSSKRAKMALEEELFGEISDEEKELAEACPGHSVPPHGHNEDATEYLERTSGGEKASLPTAEAELSLEELLQACLDDPCIISEDKLQDGDDPSDPIDIECEEEPPSPPPDTAVATWNDFEVKIAYMNICNILDDIPHQEYAKNGEHLDAFEAEAEAKAALRSVNKIPQKKVRVRNPTKHWDAPRIQDEKSYYGEAQGGYSFDDDDDAGAGTDWGCAGMAEIDERNPQFWYDAGSRQLFDEQHDQNQDGDNGLSSDEVILRSMGIGGRELIRHEKDPYGDNEGIGFDEENEDDEEMNGTWVWQDIDESAKKKREREKKVKAAREKWHQAKARSARLWDELLQLRADLRKKTLMHGLLVKRYPDLLATIGFIKINSSHRPPDSDEDDHTAGGPIPLSKQPAVDAWHDQVARVLENHSLLAAFPAPVAWRCRSYEECSLHATSERGLAACAHNIIAACERLSKDELKTYRARFHPDRFVKCTKVAGNERKQWQAFAGEIFGVVDRMHKGKV